MKKTLTINLGGIVFHIDEDAYLSLNQYLENLKKYFSNQEGAQDILNDIESRIAEILTDKQSETRQVITLEDVTAVISIMGQPIDIDQEENPGTHQDSFGERGEKRFFRNPDEKVIAGVCSGIAAYFHLDPVWVRLIFLVFVAAGGSGILMYIVLWVVIPEAKRTTDRLEMRGKKINISNIERSVREEVSELGSRIGNLTSASAASIKRAGKGSGSIFEAIGKGIVEILTFIGKGLVILSGIILILVGLSLLLLLLVYNLGWSGGIYADNDMTILPFPDLANILVGCNIPVVYLQVILLMVLGIPVFMLFYNGLRMVFRFDRIRHLGLTMFNIWVVGLFFLAWSGLRIYNLYKFDEEKQFEIAMESTAADTLFVSMFPDDPGMKYLRGEQYSLMGEWKTVITEEKELYVVPRIRIEQAHDSLFSISQVTGARGKSIVEAHQRLSGIRFQSATSGSALRISPFVRLPGEVCWRGQNVNLIIRVPKGKFVHFDHDFQYLRPFRYYSINSPTGVTFQMTEHGVDINPDHP
ncbi:MAG: PspC domain-containing protein [Bacteroidales bacterium]|nr:PspC domain-containing protein [Bacteroidales bacterium]